MRYAVTGGAGFIGSAIVKALLKQPDNEVVICDVGNPRNPYLDGLDLDGNRVDLCVADVRDRKALETFFNGVDGVFHCAAYSKIDDCIKNPELAIDVNVKGTLNVLLASRKNGVQRVIYSSSASVYGNHPGVALESDSPNPMNAYAMTKYFGELLCGEFASSEKVDTVSLRYFNVFGSELAVEGKVPFPSVVERFLHSRINNQPLTIVGDGHQRRDVVCVDDVVMANLQAMQRIDRFSGDVFNISSGKDFSVLEIAAMIGGPTVSIRESYPGPRIMRGNISRAFLGPDFKPNANALLEFIAAMKQKYNI